MRKKINIDLELVKKLCGIFCTGEEIANIIGVDYDTLNRRIKETYKMSFKEFREIHSASGKASIRRKQFEVAMNGNVTMLIWLGKQYLGQREVQLMEIQQSLPEFENMNDDELDILIKKLIEQNVANK